MLCQLDTQLTDPTTRLPIAHMDLEMTTGLMTSITKTTVGKDIMPTTRVDHAGRRPQAEHQESQFLHALLIRIEVIIYVMINAIRDLSDMDQSAGRTAQTTLRVTELTATNHMPMEEELVKNRNVMDVRNGEPSGIQNARRTSIMLDAASAHQIALLV